MDNGTDLTTIPTVEEQDALSEPASLIVSLVAVDVVVSEARLLSSPTMASDEENGAMSNLNGIDEEERVKLKRCLHDLKRSCRAQRRMVPVCLSVPVGLAVELMSDAVEASWQNEDLAVDPLVDALMGPITSTKAAVVSLTAKLSYLNDARDEAI